MNKIDSFFQETYPENSYHSILQTFLRKRKRKVSEPTVARLFYNLNPLGEKLTNKTPINEVTRKWLKTYIEELWLRYAPDTMRTLIGDIRQFFKWCKKKGYLSRNVAKHIKPIRRHRQRRTKATPENHIKELIDHLAHKIHHLVYRDLFRTLQSAPKEKWSDRDIKYYRDLFITVFLYETGARAGELSKLGSRAMNEATKNIGKAHMITVVGKTNDSDYIFTNYTAELWRVWQQIRPDNCQDYAIVGWGRAHPFGQISTDGISQMLVRRCHEADIQPFRAHSLRHAKVRRSRHLVGIEIASQLIDHRNIDTTRGYANIDEEELSDAAIKTGLQYDIWG